MNQMPKHVVSAEAKRNLDTFISDMGKVAQNSLIDPKISREIRRVLKRIKICTSEEYEVYVRRSTVMGHESTPSIEQQIRGFIDNTSSFAFKDADGENTIAVKESYIGSRGGTLFGFDLLAEEVAHCLRADYVVGTLRDMPERSLLFSMTGTTKDMVFEGILDIIRTQNLDLEPPQSEEEVIISARGFHYSIQNRYGQNYFQLNNGMYLEEMRASILQTIFLCLHLGRSDSNLHTPAIDDFIKGGGQIVQRSEIGADYVREIQSLGFLTTYLTTSESDLKKTQQLRLLIIKLCTLSIDDFLDWLSTISENSFNELSQVLLEIKRYKSGLVGDMFKGSEL